MKAYFAVLSALLCISCATDGEIEQVKKMSEQQLVFNSDRTGNHEIFIIGIDGSNTTQLTHDADYESWWPKISPDRTKILFYRAPRGKHENFAETSLWVYELKNDSVRMLRDVREDGWAMQGHAEWSPDGGKIAMFGSNGPSLEIFVTDHEGKNPVQYTNRGGYNTDVSWSPDGRKLLFNGFPADDYDRKNYEIYRMDAVPLAQATRLTNDAYADYDPYFSPDGTKIAWLRLYDPLAGPLGDGTYLGNWAICVSNADGTGMEYAIQDGNINSKPAWSLDGNVLYFHRMPYTELDFTFGLFSLTLETGAITRITATGTGTGSSEYPMN